MECETSTSSSVVIPEDSPVDEKDMPATERAIAELFDGIDAIYFKETDFKAISHEMEKLKDAALEIDVLERERFKLKRQMQVVSKKISSLILKNSLDFNNQVENYDAVREKAVQLLNLVKKLRHSLEGSRNKCKFASITLASDLKKRKVLELKRELQVVETLRRSEYRLHELTQEGDLFGFMQMAIEAINATEQYQKYSSVRQMSTKFLKILASMELKLSELFAGQIRMFQTERYRILNSAYRLLGHLEKLSSKLQTLFRNALEEAARFALLGLLRNCPSISPQELDEVSFERLCQLVSSRDALRCLYDVGIALVSVLQNYHRILHFHANDDQRQLQETILNSNVPTDGEQHPQQHNNEILALFDTPILVEKGVVQKSLLDHAASTFGCAAECYITLLKSIDITPLKFDQFLTAIDISERFRKFGERYFGNASEEIERTLEVQSRAFFQRYHAERMDELKMFLENETFTLCPVSVQFTLFDLPEFYFLKETRNDGFDIDTKDQSADVRITEQGGMAVQCLTGYDKQLNFQLLDLDSVVNELFPQLEQLEESSPRHRETQRCRTISSINSSSCDYESMEDGVFSTVQMMLPNSMPNICNTALNLLRIIGRYIQMSTILHSTAEQAIQAIIHLYNYYICTLFAFFCTDFDAQYQQQIFGINFASLRLRHYIHSIQSVVSSANILETKGDDVDKDGINQEVHVVPSPLPNRSLISDKENPEKLFSLTERIVGVESGIFMAKQMELLRPVLESLQTAKKGNLHLDSFYKMLSNIFDLREAAFGCVAAKAVPYTNLLKQVQSIDWEIGEIQSQHSPYVDTIIKEFADFRRKLDRLYAYVHISEELHMSAWSMLLLCTMRILVQGYAEARKCTIEGRALQLLDIEHLCGELEELTGLKQPLPHRAYAENYIKAFYLPAEELNQWIVHHTEYNLNQTSALLSASNPSTNKKATMSRIMANFLDASGIGGQ